jgi:hypothetical protein
MACFESTILGSEFWALLGATDELFQLPEPQGQQLFMKEGQCPPH